MEKYLIENTRALYLPSPFVFLNISDSVKFRSCYVWKCWGTQQYSPVYMSLDAGSIILEDFVGERTYSNYDFQFLYITTLDQSLPINLTRVSAHLCSENNKILEKHSSIVEGDFTFEDVNGTDNQSDMDSIFTLNSKKERNTLKRVIFKDCEAYTHTGLYVKSNIVVSYMNFINNTQQESIKNYGLFYLSKGTLEITLSNFISSSSCSLFVQQKSGEIIIKGCFLDHPGIVSFGSVDIKGNAVSSFDISISDARRSKCEYQSVKAQSRTKCTFILFMFLIKNFYF